ncbi:MAG: helix-turn-helix domain-containing protein [Clostridiales bacterium]|nr:MAG: helix-turn-helix domain-containing protein [Clostridiales bacterium]
MTNLSPNYFARLFKAETGVTPTEYLIRIRFENARVLLGETDYPIKNRRVAVRIFPTSRFFTYSFRKRFLKTPLEYRKFYMSKM